MAVGTMDLGLRNRVALVTGASSGLGLAIARELAAESARVAMAARREDVLRREAAAIARETGNAPHVIAGDLAEPDAAERFVREAEAALAPVEILVANAGGPPSTTFATTSGEQYRAALELNLLASIRLAQAVVPGMRERRWGRVIFLTSTSVKQPIRELILSNTARTGLLGFAKTLATEAAPDNVLVNTVLPGHFDTARAVELAWTRGAREGRSVAEVLEQDAAGIPLGRSGDPREMAAVVAFLASDRASFLAGAAIQVDGGQLQGLF
jgi:3-oxoacyl-[acyl-carrier protein] reductase